MMMAKALRKIVNKPFLGSGKLPIKGFQKHNISLL